MPNLIPQSVLDRFYFGWAHPAGRLIFALLAMAIGMAIVLALLGRRSGTRSSSRSKACRS